MQQLKKHSRLHDGRYWVEDVLGQGTFGITYKGFDTQRNEYVAIKEFFMKGVTERDDTDGSVIVSDMTNYKVFCEQKEKCRKEAHRISKLQSPYIVCVHDQFEENGTVYYVMDFVDGENLRERMNRMGGPLTEDEVWQLLPQVLSALRTVHANQLWHLDLKPGNIMMDREGNARLIDFGASKQLDQQSGGATAHTTISYTPGYAPLEQMDQQYDKFGPWTDIYALGATLYALLSNRRPPTPSDIDEDRTPDKHEALRLPPNVSDRMRELIIRMMRPNRKQRPQSVSEVMQLMGGSSGAADNTQGEGFRQGYEQTAYDPEQEETAYNAYAGSQDEETSYAGSQGEETSYSGSQDEETSYSGSQGEETNYDQFDNNQYYNQPPQQAQGGGLKVTLLPLLILVGVIVHVIISLHTCNGQGSRDYDYLRADTIDTFAVDTGAVDTVAAYWDDDYNADYDDVDTALYDMTAADTMAVDYDW